MATKRGSHSVIIGMLLCWSLVAAGQEFAGGTGAGGDPYQIATAEHLLGIGDDPNLLDKHFVLTADIDLSEYAFERAPLAPAADPGASFFEGDPFAGVLAGNGHVIRHLHVEGESFLGLFGGLADEAVVSGLGLEDCLIQGQYNVGGLAGYNEGSVSDCYSTGQIAGDFWVGGLVGENYGSWRVRDSHSYGWGHVSECYSEATVSGITDSVGGLVGYNGGTIWDCHSVGEVAGGLYCIGGLVGSNREGMVSGCTSSGSATGNSQGVVIDGSLIDASWGIGGLIGENHNGHVSNCFSTGAVEGVYHVGGLIGVSDDGSVSNCYSIGAVTAEGFAGGLIGFGRTDPVRCFWDVETSGEAGSERGTGLTTAEMQTIETYLEAGWDFVDESANGTAQMWSMPPEGGYPALRVLAGYEPVLPQGQGTSDDPFLITNAMELGSVGHRPRAFYRLDADLDLAGIIWSVAPVPAFAGHFDGNGHRIRQLFIEDDGVVGLFGYLGSEAVVSDLGLESVAFEDRGEDVGSLAGVNYGTLATCYCTGSVSNFSFVGKLLAYNHGHVVNCYGIGNTNTGYTVRGRQIPAGVLIGRNDGDVSTSYRRGRSVGELWFDGTTVNDLALAEMQDIETYLNAGWDFAGETDNGTEDLWTICAGQDSPHLHWEGVVCDQ